MAESRRLQAVQSPIIPDVAALIRATPGTISLGQGVVHYGPPREVFDAVANFGGQVAEHHYHPASGLPELQQELRKKLAAENDLEVQDDQVILVTAGSNMAFFHSVLAIADPGDEIVMLSPFFFNHEMAVVMANCQPVVVPTDEYYQPRLDAIEAALSPRTRAVVTVSPNNPAGVVYDPEDLRAINQLCRERNIYHIVDEAYEYFTYEDAQHFSPGSREDSRGHTISLYSFSKSYGLASWRVGYMVAPRPLLSALEKIQDTILICPPVVSQIAALGALRAGSPYCRTFIQDIARVRRLCLEHLNELKGHFQMPPAQGAFYLLVRLETHRAAMEVVEHLIRNYQVAVIPGTAFGLHQGCYIRIAYGALQQDTAAAGMDRLVGGLQDLLKG
jgi:aspartate/methionine/tyrosine aminotransferase